MNVFFVYITLQFIGGIPIYSTWQIQISGSELLKTNIFLRFCTLEITRNRTLPLFLDAKVINDFISGINIIDAQQCNL